ncbi:MAG: hypothetical protein JNK21_14130 [Rhodospirillaceae bacterium]|nr:hypothetical protein [Rhodospirillaceae bacterium]
MTRANKGSDPATSYRCIFIDSDGNRLCQLDIVAADFGHIERWASEVIERSTGDLTGAEIWRDGQQMALLGVAIAAQPPLNSRLSPHLFVPVQRKPNLGPRKF